MLRTCQVLLLAVLVTSALAAYTPRGGGHHRTRRYNNNNNNYASSLKRMGNFSKYESLGADLQKIYNGLQKRARQVEDHGPLYKPHRYNYRRNVAPTTMSPGGSPSEYRRRNQLAPRSRKTYRVPTVNRNRRVNSLWHPYVNRLRSSRAYVGYYRPRPSFNWKKTSPGKTWGHTKHYTQGKQPAITITTAQSQSTAHDSNAIQSKDDKSSDTTDPKINVPSIAIHIRDKSVETINQNIDVPNTTEEIKQIDNSTALESSYIKICPTDFLRLGNGCYYFSKSTGPWQWAHFECRARDSQLAVVDTAWEDSTLRAYLNNQDIDRVNRWIGGIHDWNQREWVWGGSGKTMKYKGFVPDPAPTSSSPQWACVLMEASVFYRWNYDKCTDSMHFICESPFENNQE